MKELFICSLHEVPDQLKVVLALCMHLTLDSGAFRLESGAGLSPHIAERRATNFPSLKKVKIEQQSAES